MTRRKRHNAVMVQVSARRWVIQCLTCTYESERRYPERLAVVACEAHDYYAERLDRLR